MLVIGLPFFWLFMLSIEGLAFVEGRLIEGMTGVRMPRRSPTAPRTKGVWKRFVARLTDGRTWATLIYLILKLPLGVISFALFVTFLAYALQLIASPILQYGFGQSLYVINDTRITFPWWSLPILVFAGILEIALVLHLAKIVARINGAFAKAMLVRT